MNQTLPVVEHTLEVYKKWYGFRDHFPKKSRYTLGDKIDTHFINVLEFISIATYQSPADKLYTLDKAITTIDVLKFFVRAAWELHIFDDKKYKELSIGINEIGRQVGAWRKGIQNKTPNRKS